MAQEQPKTYRTESPTEFANFLAGCMIVDANNPITVRASSAFLGGDGVGDRRYHFEAQTEVREPFLVRHVTMATLAYDYTHAREDGVPNPAGDVARKLEDVGRDALRISRDKWGIEATFQVDAGTLTLSKDVAE